MTAEPGAERLQLTNVIDQVLDELRVIEAKLGLTQAEVAENPAPYEDIPRRLAILIERCSDLTSRLVNVKVVILDLDDTVGG